MLRRVEALHSTPIYSSDALRNLETEAALGLPPHGLMQRAGDAVARLARSAYPHARRIVVLAGAGNNGGDGLVAAAQLHQAGREVKVLACGGESLQDWIARAEQSGIRQLEEFSLRLRRYA